LFHRSGVVLNGVTLGAGGETKRLGQAAGPFSDLLTPPLRDSSDASMLSTAAKIDLILAHSQSPLVSDKALVDTVRDREFLADANRAKLNLNPLGGKETKDGSLHTMALLSDRSVLYKCTGLDSP
jgi:hypothetical protein